MDVNRFIHPLGMTIALSAINEITNPGSRYLTMELNYAADLDRSAFQGTVASKEFDFKYNE